MDIQRINQYKDSFDSICQTISSDDGKEQIEVWFARDLQNVLGYARWENFQVAISRSVESCKQQGINVDDHFREVTKMIPLAKGAQREIIDYMLTRFACYLIAQNGDPKKEEIAFAQGYFAVQTRKAELISERLQEISRLETRDRLRASEKQLLTRKTHACQAQMPMKGGSDAPVFILNQASKLAADLRIKKKSAGIILRIITKKNERWPATADLRLSANS